MKRVFVAEDSPLQQDLIRAALDAQSDLALTFYDDGLALYFDVMETVPDLLILDIIMPSLNGIAICRLLKFHETRQDVPVLVMSSITDADIRDRVKKAGAELFIPKPFTPDALLKAVRSLLP